jgi:hypothetical protein
MGSMGSPVLTTILLVLRFGIGLILFRLALNPKFRNLHWLAAVFYLNFLLLFLRGPGMRVVAMVLIVVIQICLAMFTHTTFYKNRRSPVGWVIGGLVLGGVVSLYLSQRYPGFLGIRVLQMTNVANWFWHALTAWLVWRKLRPDQTIEDWIKARYVLVVAYALAMSAIYLFPARQSSLPSVRMASNAVFVVSLVLQYLAWGMPGFFRRFLNRNYQASAAVAQAQNMTEEDVLRALEKQAR